MGVHRSTYYRWSARSTGGGLKRSTSASGDGRGCPIRAHRVRPRGARAARRRPDRASRDPRDAVAFVLRGPGGGLTGSGLRRRPGRAVHPGRRARQAVGARGRRDRGSHGAGWAQVGSLKRSEGQWRSTRSRHTQPVPCVHLANVPQRSLASGLIEHEQSSARRSDFCFVAVGALSSRQPVAPGTGASPARPTLAASAKQGSDPRAGASRSSPRGDGGEAGLCVRRPAGRLMDDAVGEAESGNWAERA